MRLSRTLWAIGLAWVMGGCSSLPPRSPAGHRDHFLGWFRRFGTDAAILVFKRDGAYCSVCRGVEVPLKPCAEGLEWAIAPSSMTGTKIGWDAGSETHYLAVVDAQASQFSDGQSGVGEKEALVRIAEPSGLPEARARRPRVLDDFLGWYQAVWFPGVAFEIRKESDRYVTREYECRGPWPGSWQTRLESRDLTPLPGQLGFTGLERGHRTRIVFHRALQRFEVVMTDTNRNPSVLRMPLARFPAPPSPEGGALPVSRVRMGIPSWH